MTIRWTAPLNGVAVGVTATAANTGADATSYTGTAVGVAGGHAPYTTQVQITGRRALAYSRTYAANERVRGWFVVNPTSGAAAMTLVKWEDAGALTVGEFGITAGTVDKVELRDGAGGVKAGTETLTRGMRYGFVYLRDRAVDTQTVRVYTEAGVPIEYLEFKGAALALSTLCRIGQSDTGPLSSVAISDYTESNAEALYIGGTDLLATPVPTGAPPRMDVLVSDISLTAGTPTSITIRRTVPSTGGYTNVRGAVRVPLTGDVFYVADYEAPLNVPVTYTAVLYDAAGAVLTAPAESYPKTIAVSTEDVWLSDPLRPDQSLKVLIASWPARSYPQRLSLLPVAGRARPVALFDTRGAAEADVSFIVPVGTELLALRTLLYTTNPVLLRFGDPAWYQADGTFAVGAITEENPLDYALATDRVFGMKLVEVDAPYPDVIAPTYTWTDVVAGWATWADLVAGRATWLQVTQDAPNA